MSTTGLVAQSPADSIIFYRSVLLALLLALILIFFSPWLSLLAKPFSQDATITAKLAQYITIRLYAAPGSLVNYVLLGYCFGRQNTKLAWLLLSLTNISAIVLDYLLVWQWHMNSTGIAISQVIAQTIGALVGFALIYRLYLKQSLITEFWYKLFDKTALSKLFHLNKDIFIRTLVLIATQAFFTYQSTKLGLTIIAANAILMHCQMLSAYSLDGFAIACESLIGQAIGNKDKAQFFKTLKDCSSWSVIIALGISTVYFFAGTLYLHLMTDIKAIREVAAQYLPWIIALPLLSVPSFLLDGVYIGATWSKPLRNTILFASFLVFLPVWYLSQSLANHGLWLAYSSFIVARGLYLAYDLKFHRIKLMG